MYWITDFLEAERAGMALRLPLDSAQQARDGLLSLLVIGVKASLDAPTTHQTVADWIDAHHYTGGISLLPNGTPTNNTAQEDSDYTADPKGYDTYEVEQKEKASLVTAGSDGERLAQALGIPARLFAHVAHADQQTDTAARAMNIALWPATWGHYLKQMLADDFFDSDRWWGQKMQWIEWARLHYRDQVRGGGPLAALRIDQQPYGLLPATSLSRWKPEETAQEFYHVLPDVLRTLRGFWDDSTGDVPRAAGFNPNDSDAAYRRLLEILQVHAQSQLFYGRVRLSRTAWMNHLLRSGNAIQHDLNQWLKAEGKADTFFNTQILRPVGINRPDTSIRLARSLYTDHAAALCVDLIEPDAPEYLRLMNDKRDYTALKSESPFSNLSIIEEPSLLYLLVRYAALLQHGELAFHALLKQGVVSLDDWIIPEVADVEPDEETGLPRQSATQQWVERLAQETNQTPLDVLNGNASLDPTGQRAVDSFQDFWQNGVMPLSQLGIPQLEQHLVETLDTTAYRLDAWMTSLPTHRLFQQRQNQPEGLHIGGYGWLEHLAAAADGASRQTDAHFVHAPSLSQATTAAVLRNGYLTRANGTGSNPLALDMSSDRMRLATQMFAGIRAGLSLGELLGYRFERSLREHLQSDIDTVISRFRQQFPLVAGKRENGPSNTDAAARSQVVDGLALVRAWRQGKSLPSTDGSTGGDAETYVAQLADIVDAMKDLSLCEAVFQHVSGSTDAAAASLEAISRGEVPPPEANVLESGRRGSGVTHRVMLVLNRKAQATTHRTSAAPYLAAWAEEMLPPLQNVVFTARYRDADGNIIAWTEPDGTQHTERTIGLDELDIAPLDVVYIMREGSPTAQADWERRLRRYVMHTRNFHIPADAQTEFVFNLSRTDIVTVPELWELARSVYAIMSGNRPLQSEDWHRPLDLSEEPQPSSDPRGSRLDPLVTTFRNQVSQLRQEFSYSLPQDADKQQKLASLAGVENASKLPNNLLDLPPGTDLQSFCDILDTPDLSQLDPLRDMLMKLADFGIPGSVPRSNAGETSAARADLVAQIGSLYEQLQQRRAQAADASRTVGERYAALFGEDFQPLPPTVVLDSTHPALAQNLLSQNSNAAAEWFRRAAQVRDALQSFQDALLYAEAINGKSYMHFEVAQLPYQKDARWIALTFDKQDGSMSLVILAPNGVTPSQPVYGLFIDEWTELVPDKTQTTGITFQYDAPGACAPNAMLLAVSPDGNPWTAEVLRDIVRETLDLAQLRAVDPDILRDLGHFLPAALISEAETDMNRATCRPETYDPREGINA
jgi:hypothetical protein